MSVSRTEDGNVVVSFATNKGKGTGAQVMSATQYSEYVSTLEEIAEYGIEETPDSNLSPSEMVRETISHRDGIISFRVRGGKGAKPARVPSDRFSEFVTLLRSTVDLVEQAADTLSSAPPEEESDGE